MQAITDAIFPIPAQTFVGIITVLVMIHAILLTIPILIYFERKISAYIQDRIGPNRVGFDFGLPFLQKLFSFGGKRPFGFWGLGQSAADGLKFLLKEDVTPRGADKWLFSIAPMAAVVPAFIGWAVIPWGGTLTITNPINLFGLDLVAPGNATVAVADINIGFIYLLAIASLGIYGVTLGGWSSNSKFSFLGGMRASANMISYEIPLGLALLATLLLAGSFRASDIITMQASAGWFVLAQPLACIIFFVCVLAECNRAPFDNAEAEQELVGGFHTEYSAMRFALFFLAEYAHMITASAFLILVFFGGYHLPFVPLTAPEATGLLAALVKTFVFFNKVILVVVVMMVIRWTLPRIRYDQVLRLCWQALIPITISLVVLTAIWMKLGWTAWPQTLAMNILALIVITAIAPALFNSTANNRKVPLAGSRFSPLKGYEGTTTPTDPVHLDDDNPQAARA
ncbi:MAG: NADH-quinone oxidoreductase subunit H [Phycisphaeraceae bacterium]|nr:MAG: NADH-quinone oxidoreductase subunit H [Phycisphaeraceae bacterium]